MRNGFRTAGFSEVMHEIREDSAEASYRYTAVAYASPQRGFTARIGPALFGSVKSARDFTIAVGTDDDGTGDPSPMELALTGIAACAVTTLLAGGSARGVIFDSAEMVIAHQAESVHCRLVVEGAADPALMDELIEQMRNFSPNMATLTRAVPARFSCTAGTSARQLFADAGDLTPPAAARRLRWLTGTQLESSPVVMSTTAPLLRVDQPKQMTGCDWGPNPQEYLLLGLAADIVAHLDRESSRLKGERYTWKVVATAREDIRGMLLKDPDCLVLQDVECTAVLPAALHGDASVDDITRSAFARSAVRDLIARPYPVEVDLVAAGCRLSQ